MQFLTDGCTNHNIITTASEPTAKVTRIGETCTAFATADREHTRV